MILEDEFTEIRREIQEDQQRISELKTEIEDLQEYWDSDRREPEIEEFRENALEHRDSITGGMQLNELEATIKDILQAYNDPVLSSIQRLLHDIIAELEIEANDDEVGQIITRVEEHEQSLTTLRNLYQKSIRLVQSSPDVVVAQIAEEIEKNPVKLSSPKPNILNPLGRHNDNYAVLSQATGELSSRQWAPKQLPLQEKSELYPDSALEKDHLLQYVRDIEDQYTCLNDLGISWHLAIKNEIEAKLPNKEIGHALGTVGARCQDLASKEAQLKMILDITEHSSPKADSSKAQTTLENLQEVEYTSLDTLSEDLQTVSMVLENWKRTQEERWKRTESLLSKYEDVLDTNRPDKIVFNDSYDSLLESDVTAAIELYQAARAWIKQQREEGLDTLSPTAQDVFDQLLSDETVYLSKCDQDDLSELMDLVDITLSIEYE